MKKKFSDLAIAVKAPGVYSYELGQSHKTTDGTYDFELEGEYVFGDKGELIEFNLSNDYSKEEAGEIQEEVRKQLTLKHFNIVFSLIKKLMNNEEELKFSVSKLDEHVVQFKFEGFEGVEGFLSLEAGFLFKSGGELFEIRNLENFCPKLEKELANHPKVRVKALFLSKDK